MVYEGILRREIIKLLDVPCLSTSQRGLTFYGSKRSLNLGRGAELVMNICQCINSIYLFLSWYCLKGAKALINYVKF